MSQRGNNNRMSRSSFKKYYINKGGNRSRSVRRKNKPFVRRHRVLQANPATNNPPQVTSYPASNAANNQTPMNPQMVRQMLDQQQQAFNTQMKQLIDSFNKRLNNMQKGLNNSPNAQITNALQNGFNQSNMNVNGAMYQNVTSNTTQQSQAMDLWHDDDEKIAEPQMATLDLGNGIVLNFPVSN